MRHREEPQHDPPSPQRKRKMNPNSLANLRRGPGPGLRPAPLGNTRAVTHGARATIRRDELDDEVAEIYRALAESAPVRDPDGGLPQADEAAIEIAARALKRWRRIVTWLDLHGRIDEQTGEPKAAAGLELSCERRLHEALDVLGMNPASRQKIGLDVARASQFDLAAHWQHESEDWPIDAEAEDDE
jgi:hypothetical protein